MSAQSSTVPVQQLIATTGECSTIVHGSSVVLRAAPPAASRPGWRSETSRVARGRSLEVTAARVIPQETERHVLAVRLPAGPHSLRPLTSQVGLPMGQPPATFSEYSPVCDTLVSAIRVRIMSATVTVAATQQLFAFSFLSRWGCRECGLLPFSTEESRPSSWLLLQPCGLLSASSWPDRRHLRRAAVVLPGSE